MKNFYEVNVSKCSVEHLLCMKWIITNNGNGWVDKIENLEMTLNDEEQIIVRGWATKQMWRRFVNMVINDHRLDYLFMNEGDAQ